jgi:hypothetical protein
MSAMPRFSSLNVDWGIASGLRAPVLATETLTARYGSPPEAASGVPPRRRTGLAPVLSTTSPLTLLRSRPPLAYSPGKSCPCPIATATAAGCSVGDGQAGSSMLPWGEVSLTMSPRESPSRVAVSAGTSTHPSQVICVIVSGASWSHG